MSGSILKTWATRVAVWACVATFLATGVTGVARHRQEHKLSTADSLNDLLDRLDSSINEKTTRLQRGVPPSFHYRTDPEASVVEDEGPTIVQEGSPWEGEETRIEDTSDYVNAAPWTRRQKQTGPTLADHDLQMIKLASENARWVKANGKCEVPLRRCVTVSSEELGPSARYWPRCALLHRCADDTGCCNSPEMTCAAADSENVQLYFYVFQTGRAGVQMVTFANHTRCSCQPRSALAINRQAIPDCQCTRHFSPRLRAGQCSCDCEEGKSKCRRLRRGRRYFSGVDINCVSRGECVQPTCEYGPFLLKQRRCTKRRERERYTTVRR